jgi:hypothetical protein
VELHEIYADEQLYSLHITKIEYLKMIKTQLISLVWQMEGRGEIHLVVSKMKMLRGREQKKPFTPCYSVLQNIFGPAPRNIRVE